MPLTKQKLSVDSKRITACNPLLINGGVTYGL